jgi:hypothetical protein
MSVSQESSQTLQSSKEHQMKRIVMASTVLALGLAISGTALAGNKGSGSGAGSGSSTKGGAMARSTGLRNVGNQTLGSNSGVAKKVGGNQQGNNQSGSSQSQSNKKGADTGNKGGSKSKDSTGSSNHKVQYTVKKHCDFKDYHGHCYTGGFRFWSQCYFDAHYGCEIYYCPVRTCWYFWFEPWDCYLPCDYWVNVCHL